ncbi:hypothetical protein [Aporhodopirellula aestuarii]|uniref:Uncharacterized protein n=1 Tax=Aporhodopirellula aestuarii TaxID=2950107 RepID=A0ABT0UCH0_9BACT|nr:hypothetical protein [Aporhodopirellula aestuarii]MCM2374579.1 hypothetical protein [Aporhodopirellula aestuarii]
MSFAVMLYADHGEEFTRDGLVELFLNMGAVYQEDEYYTDKGEIPPMPYPGLYGCINVVEKLRTNEHGFTCVAWVNLGKAAKIDEQLPILMQIADKSGFKFMDDDADGGFVELDAEGIKQRFIQETA